MSHFRAKRLLLTVLYITTTVLLTVEQSTQCFPSYCCCLYLAYGVTDVSVCRRAQPEPTLTESQHILELRFNETISDSVVCGANISNPKWYKREKCFNCPTQFTNGHSLLFRGDLSLKDQGNYFCVTAEQDGPSTFKDIKRVFVTIEGADTYSRSFHLQRYSSFFALPWCNEAKINNIEQCVKETFCPLSDTSECDYVVHGYTWYTNWTLEAVQGLFYIKNFHNMGALEEFHQSRDFENTNCQLLKSWGYTFHLSGKLQPVSFCEPENYSHEYAGNLTFLKTNIGRNAISEELCEDGTPRASRMCNGNFITPSMWADPVVGNCTHKDDNFMYTHITDVVTQTTPWSITTDPEPTAVSTNIFPDSTILTTSETKETTIERKTIVIDNTPVTKENVNEVSRVLSESTRHPQNFNVTYMMWASERLKNISEVGSSSDKVTSSVIDIVDNLLNAREDVYKEIISRGAPSMILHALETQLTNLQKGGENFTYVVSSVGALAIQVERPSFTENLTFGGIFSTANESMNDSDISVVNKKGNSSTKYPATITLPANLLDDITIGQNGTIPVTFIIHRTSLLFLSNSSQQRQQRESIESLVIAATIEGRNISNLSSPVISRFHLPHVEDNMTKTSRKCVFWDFTSAGGLGDWSSEGCKLVSGSRDKIGLVVECHCNHLTNFAVLLDVQGDIDHEALDIISVIGCVVSIFALIITLIVLLAVKKLRDQIPQQIIINLCLALLGLYICFLTGIDKSSLGTGCVIFGALIHYFCLASVAWMCIVAINMYLLFVRVFNADVAGFTWKACIVAWGLPMVVVIVSVILTHQNYTGSYCFPQTGTLTFDLGVLLLIALMLGFNLIIFTLIIRRVTCGRIGKPAGQDKRTEMFERAQSIIIISVLLGLTWVFGFLSIGGARFIFNLLFLIFNSLQGLFIFVFFVLRPKNVRMILFKRCYRRKQSNVGKYTVNKTKTEENIDQKDTLDLDAIVVTSSQT